jgi:tetraacyldisaccharide 4'-kinase
MNRRVESWLTQRWYGGVTPGLGLRSLAGIYRILQNAAKPDEVERLDVPVIVIGNFTAGGTGKTPLVIALGKFLAESGFRPGIVSRGHGRKSSLPLRVTEETPADLCGDEPKLMFEKTGLPVLVDRDRVAAARAAVEAGCNLILADDGLQHRRLGRDVEIEVVDGERGYGNGLLLPAGPLRERPRVCDFRVVNGQLESGSDWSMQLVPADALSLSDTGICRSLSLFAGAPVHAVAGIGNPTRFFNALRALGLQPVEHPFEDHHRFIEEDFAGLAGPILMTEKDAVKCRGLELVDAWAVPVEAHLSPEFYSAIDSKLKEKHA